MDKESLGLQDRNFYLLEMVRGLLLSEVAFQEISQKYKKGRLRFSDVGNWGDDKGKSILYNLKEQCHSLFRRTGKGPLHKKEWLLDLAIGSIFNEAMKLRENLYQAEAYRPKYLEYKSKAGKSPYEKEHLQEFARIIERAEQGVKAEIVAVDASPAALAVARHNAKALRLARVAFLQGRWFEPVVSRRFDAIVANPPYLAADDPHLAALNREPPDALVAGPTGLEALEAIVAGASSHLRPGGLLLLEHGCEQGAAVRARCLAAGLTEVATLRDLAGLERVTRACHAAAGTPDG